MVALILHLEILMQLLELVQMFVWIMMMIASQIGITPQINHIKWKMMARQMINQTFLTSKKVMTNFLML